MIYELNKLITVVTLRGTDSKGEEKSEGRKIKVGGNCSGADKW